MRLTKGKRQQGYTLLLILLALMGLGGFVATQFTQEAREKAEAERYLHNQRVLAQAKQALLMYAYNYPAIALPNIRGPGRLPCPDTDSPGQPGSGTPNVSPNCGGAATPNVGRFPWNAAGLNFYDARDASGEPLWYAVSSAFDHGDDDLINSGTDGTITLFDQAGSEVYDGLVSGIAAVIIAPGPTVSRDEDGNGTYEYTQIRGTVAQRADPRNYLDAFTGFDNASFDNTNNANLDGFILGPVFDANQNQIVVNDQFVVVTTDEVIEISERAVLEAYRDSIDDYHQAIWGATAADYRYPWLDGYVGITDLEVYNPAVGAIAGRVPFFNYYVDHDSHTLVTEIVIDYQIDFNLTDAGVDGGGYLSEFDGEFDTHTINIDDANLTFEQTTFDDAVNLATDNLGTLRVHEDAVDATVLNPTPQATLYFWDGCPTCVEPADGWERCAFPATSETHCAMNNPPGPYNFVPFTGDWDDHADIRIRFVTLEVEVDEVFELGLDYDPATNMVVNFTDPPTAILHAWRETGIAAAITDLEIETGDALQEFIDIVKIACEQDNFVGSNYNVPSFNPDASSYDCFADLTPSAAPTLPPAQFNVFAEYFPELPVWVRDNRWNDSILMAYDNDFEPSVVGGGPMPDCTDNLPNCITVNREYAGQTTDNVMVLVHGSEVPTGPPPALVNIFQDENLSPLDYTFTAQPEPGDDTLLIFDQI